MSIEQFKGEPRPTNNASDFLVGHFFAPYLDEANLILSEADAFFARQAIPQLLSIFFLACERSGITEVTAGGTTMEAFSELEAYGSSEKYTNAYWSIKKKFVFLDSDTTNLLETNIRGDISKAAFTSLAGDPDLDTQFFTDEELKAVHSQLQATSIPEWSSISFGPISDTNKVKLLCLQIISPITGKKIFHIDSTAPPTTGEEVALNRRIGTTSYQSQVSHRINTHTGEIIAQTPVDLDEPVSFDLKDRSPAAAIEVILRQIRKTHVRRLAHPKSSSIIDLTDIFDENTIFDFIHLASNPKNRDLFDTQSPIQQKMWLMEFYTILMTDLQSVDTLFQLKLLPLITGTNFSRRQILGLMSSKAFTFNSPDAKLSNRTRNKNIAEMNSSIANFRQLPLDHHARNGLVAFAKSLENIDPAPPIKPNPIRPRRLRNIYNTLLDWGGGITTTTLHKILASNQFTPPLTETGKIDFTRRVVSLIASGHIEVLTRNLNGEQVRFLYPIAKSPPISEFDSSPFSTAESVFGLRVKDGELFPAIVRAHFDNLDHLQRILRLYQLEKENENPWFDPRIDS